MLETRTRLQYANPAARNASSKDASFSLWTPTPLVKKHFFGIMVRCYNMIKKK
jgi:hypothetical protein